jgi:CubicO group peptidase (beta-lactamase class C family)
MIRTLLVLTLSVLTVGLVTARQAASPVPDAKIDAVFARWTGQTPGCAVGVSRAGTPIVQKAYGMADLEHDVPNRPDTIFEAGSVSKQFTAAAVLLLAQEGKLSLDDPARKYVPELPDYGAPLTIRHMLQHTSGLRDWGEVASLAGWPRTSRVHTHAHVLEILSRQKALNFPSGTQYSYSNSGYNLAAIIVSRVSGKSFADFSRERIFAPLGMTRTSWRDDHTRIVKGRATAYAAASGGFRINMPFENVHGNGGLLTTVGDLLTWNENFVTPKVGDAALVKLQQTPGVFNDGTPHTYAMGLIVAPYRGVAEVGHSGSTAGYRAHLTRFPEQRLSVAVLCNVTSVAATQYARTIADMYLGDALQPVKANTGGRGGAPQRGVQDPSDRSRPIGPAPFGRFYSDEAEVMFEIELGTEELILKRRPDVRTVLRKVGDDEYTFGGNRLRFIRDAKGEVTELSVRGSRVFDLRFRRVN